MNTIKNVHSPAGMPDGTVSSKTIAKAFNNGLLVGMRTAHKVAQERKDGRSMPSKQIAAWCENTALVIEERIAANWKRIK